MGLVFKSVAIAKCLQDGRCKARGGCERMIKDLRSMQTQVSRLNQIDCCVGRIFETFMAEFVCSECYTTIHSCDRSPGTLAVPVWESSFWPQNMVSLLNRSVHSSNTFIIYKCDMVEFSILNCYEDHEVREY